MMKLKFNDNDKCYLISNCLPVKGAIRSIMYDIQRQSYSFMPNDLYELIKNGILPSKAELYGIYGDDNQSIIDQYFEYLIEHEYIYQTDNPDFFPKLDLSVDRSYVLQDAILERNKRSTYDIESLLKQLEDLNCQHLELRYYDKITYNELKATIDFSNDFTFKSISLVFQSINGLEIGDYRSSIHYNQKVLDMIVYNSDQALIDANEDERIVFTKKMISDNSCCGEISPYYFRVSLPMYDSNKNFNSCIDAKIAIDVNGNYKNCPSLPNIYGNVNDKGILEVITQKSFKTLWEINKDQIKVCQDCEFRYMCSDCRAYITDNTDIYSKPSKCTYNPYEATW